MLMYLIKTSDIWQQQRRCKASWQEKRKESYEQFIMYVLWLVPRYGSFDRGVQPFGSEIHI